MHALPRARVRAVVVVGLVSLSAALFAMTARPQGISATAKVTPATPTSDVNTLKRRVDELERRILELEKQKADSADEAAKDSRKESDFDAQNVIAPFVVRDEDGKVLVRIDRSPAGFARLAVGNPGVEQGRHSMAELVGMDAQDGRFQITDATGAAMIVAAISTKGVGVVRTGPGGNGPAAMLGNIALPASGIQGRKR